LLPLNVPAKSQTPRVELARAMYADCLASVKAEQDCELAKLERQAHIISEAANETGDEATA
jgi:hypothetical protein